MGKEFDEKMLTQVLNPSSKAYKELQKVIPDIAARKVINNVKICLTPGATDCTAKGSYFIADQVLVKIETNSVGVKKIVDMVVVEVKLTAKTLTTTGQDTAAKSIGNSLALRTTRQADADKVELPVKINPGDAITLNKFVKIFGDDAGEAAGAIIHIPKG